VVNKLYVFLLVNDLGAKLGKSITYWFDKKKVMKKTNWIKAFKWKWANEGDAFKFFRFRWAST
jgi:hypothetical protein